MTVRPYDVGPDVSTFSNPPVPPNSLVFRNGVLQTENDNYDIIDGRLQMRPTYIGEHDLITVVTFA